MNVDELVKYTSATDKLNNIILKLKEQYKEWNTLLNHYSKPRFLK
jgi:hypothetical protein